VIINACDKAIVVTVYVDLMGLGNAEGVELDVLKEKTEYGKDSICFCQARIHFWGRSRNITFITP